MMFGTPKRLAYFLPNIFTALNIACGFFSIILSWQGNIYFASIILILGSIFDSVDGRVARLTGTQSAFGEQFDSISDVVSFGVAPAFLVYNNFFHEVGRFGLVASFIFLLCGALRLARFNANIDKVSSAFFQGLPIPSGALSVVGLCLFSIEFPEVRDFPRLVAIFVIFISLLMISNIPFNSFKNSEWVKRHKKGVFLIILLYMVSVITYEHYAIFIGLMGYILGTLFWYFTHRGEMSKMFDVSGPEELLEND